MSLDRRQLLAASGAAFALGALPTLRAQGQTPKKFKKAVMLGMVEGPTTLVDKFKLLRECGFDGVELDSPSDLKTDELLAAKQATGIEVEGTVDSVHWNKPLSDPDEKVRDEGRAGLERAIEDCKSWGGTSVLLVPAVVNEKVSYDAAW